MANYSVQNVSRVSRTNLNWMVLSYASNVDKTNFSSELVRDSESTSSAQTTRLSSTRQSPPVSCAYYQRTPWRRTVNHTNTNDSNTNNTPNTASKTNWSPHQLSPLRSGGASLSINLHHLVLVRAEPGRYGRLERQEEQANVRPSLLGFWGISDDFGDGNEAA